jgi:hypothetical protein
MQTRPRRIVPLRPPTAATPDGDDRVHAASVARARLQATFTSFYNALFDTACIANDEQRHERTIQLLRTVKAEESAIVDAVCADVALSGTPGEALEARFLRRALAQHCAALALEPGEQALLEAAVAEQMLAPDDRLRTAHEAAAPGDDRDSAARLVARLRAVGLQLEPEPETAAAGADSGPPSAAEPEQAPAAVAPTPRTQAGLRRAALALVALSAFTLSALFIDPMRTTIRQLAPAAARITPAPAPKATSFAVRETRHAASLPRRASEEAVATKDPAPVSEPVPTAERREDAGRAPEAPAVASAVGTATAPPREVPPPAAARLATQVDYLLQRGDAALAALRLSEPFADSAAANYAAVLAIDAQNAEARRGLERIVEVYAGLARGALQRGDKGYALQLLARARTVLPESAALQQLEQDITNAHLAGR